MLSIKGLKCDSKELKAKQSAVLAARNVLKSVENYENECKLKVLESNEFYNEMDDHEPRRITHPNSDFMMSETEFEKYMQLCNDEMIKKYPDAEVGIVYSWRFKVDLKNKEDDLLKFAKENIILDNIDNSAWDKLTSHWKLRDEAIALTLNIMKYKGGNVD